MRQPEAKFKSKLIETHRAQFSDHWHTYLSPGGPGQKPGMPDLLIGSNRHPLLWIEAKVGAGKPRLRQTQKRTLASLRSCAASVVVLSQCGHLCVEVYGIGTMGEPEHLGTSALDTSFWRTLLDWMDLS